MSVPHVHGVRQTTHYERGKVTAVSYHCIACGETWEDPDLRAAIAAKTASRGDRIVQEHWDVCRGGR